MKKQLRLPGTKLFTMLFLLTISLYGCSSSYSVRSTDYGEVNKELKERNATIELVGGQEIPAKDVNISHDSVSWIDPRTNDESRASTDRISKITIKNHLIGAFEGLGIGLVGGGGLGALVGQIFATPGGTSTFGSGYGAAFGFIIGGGAGVIFGTMAGAGIGHSYNYEFQESGRDDSSILIEESSTTTDVPHVKNDGIIRGTIVLKRQASMFESFGKASLMRSLND